MPEDVIEGVREIAKWIGVGIETGDRGLSVDIQPAVDNEKHGHPQVQNLERAGPSANAVEGASPE